jgi:hypothetical protein
MKVLTALLLAAVLVLVMCAVGQGDIIHLTAGGRIDGKIVHKDPNGDMKVKKAGGITVKIKAEDIERIEKCPSVFDVYEEKLKETAKDDIKARFELGTWCRVKGLKPEAKKHFKEVIALSGPQRSSQGTRLRKDRQRLGKRNAESDKKRRRCER